MCDRFNTLLQQLTRTFPALARIKPRPVRVDRPLTKFNRNELHQLNSAQFLLVVRHAMHYGLDSPSKWRRNVEVVAVQSHRAATIGRRDLLQVATPSFFESHKPIRNMPIAHCYW
jgi:hypothetical protein